MKLLVIEDNPILRERVERLFSREWVVTTASTGEEGVERAMADQAVILLDLGLPDMNGLDVCRAIRNSGVETPILVLTAEGGVTSRVTLLDAGADDYLVKPFHGEELRARAKALARRQRTITVADVLELGELAIDRARRTVQRAGVPIVLRRKEFDILEYLVRNEGRVVTRSMIIDHVWDSDSKSWGSTVDVHINRLRDKVDRPFLFPYIHTAHGLGYMVAVPERVK